MRFFKATVIMVVIQASLPGFLLSAGMGNKADILNKGIEAFWINDYDKASAYYQEVLAVDPQNRDALRLIGTIYYYQGKMPEALYYLLLAAKEDGDNYEVLFNLGRTYLAIGDLNNAEGSFRETINLNREFNLGYYYLAQTLEKQGKVKESLEYYRQAFKKDSNFMEVRFDLARIYEKLQLWNEAWEQYTRILKVVPGQAIAQANRQKIIPLLTKKPEEIIPPKKIVTATAIKPIPGYQDIPLIRVGIGTGGKGAPVFKEKVMFRCSADFRIIAAESRKTLVQGEKEKLYTIKLLEKKNMRISSETQAALAETGQTIDIETESQVNNTIILEQIQYAGGFAWGGEEDREYRGIIEIAVHKEGGLNIVNVINIEEYLYSVLPSEMISSWPMEALKAQAVIARGEAWYKKDYTKPHKAFGYDVCDSQHCQVYSGVKSEGKRAREAVEETKGELPLYRGKIAHTLYSSNCGGHTQSCSELKGWGDEPYLKGISDSEQAGAPQTNMEIEEWLKHSPQVFCNIPKYCYPPEFRWARVFTRKDLEESINRIDEIGQLKAIIPQKRSKSGHINEIEIKGTKKNLVVDKENVIRQIFGLGFLRSTLFLVETKMEKNGTPESFTFYGGGWGHGVGMCQTGAAGMAEKGYNYQDIMKQYYTDISIEKKEY